MLVRMWEIDLHALLESVSKSYPGEEFGDNHQKIKFIAGRVKK